ncbi:hypothetical protein TNCV_616691 [Trichonephila clavipes]|nr:hypothetical protein TNCV_616691 [Trichonephila clavipes]
MDYVSEALLMLFYERIWKANIPEVHQVEASAIETPLLLGIYREAMSKIIAACRQRGKTCSTKQNSGLSTKLIERYRQILRQIVLSKNQQTNNCTKKDSRAQSAFGLIIFNDQN